MRLDGRAPADAALMSFYRLCYRSRRTAAFRGLEEIEAATDAEAIRRARRRVGRRPAELWRRDRLITAFGTIPPRPRPG